MTNRQRRHLQVLEALVSSPLTTTALARVVGLPDSQAMFLGRKLQHVVGDLGADGLVYALPERIREGGVNGKLAKAFAVTVDGHSELKRLRTLSGDLRVVPSTPEPLFEWPPPEVDPEPVDDYEPAYVPVTTRSPLLGGSRAVRPAGPGPESKVVPMPERRVPTVPPVPVRGQLKQTTAPVPFIRKPELMDEWMMPTPTRPVPAPVPVLVDDVGRRGRYGSANVPQGATTKAVVLNLLDRITSLEHTLSCLASTIALNIQQENVAS